MKKSGQNRDPLVESKESGSDRLKRLEKNRCRRIDKITIGQTDKMLGHKSD